MLVASATKGKPHAPHNSLHRNTHGITAKLKLLFRRIYSWRIAPGILAFYFGKINIASLGPPLLRRFLAPVCRLISPATPKTAKQKKQCTHDFGEKVAVYSTRQLDELIVFFIHISAEHHKHFTYLRQIIDYYFIHIFQGR